MSSRDFPIARIPFALPTFISALLAPVHLVNDDDLVFVVDAVDDSVWADANAMYFTTQFFDTYWPGVTFEGVNGCCYARIVVIVHLVQLLFDTLAGNLNPVHCLWPFAQRRTRQRADYVLRHIQIQR